MTISITVGGRIEIGQRKEQREERGWIFVAQIIMFFFSSSVCIIWLLENPCFPNSDSICFHMFELALLSVAFGAFMRVWEKHQLFRGINGHAVGFLLIFAGGLMFGGYCLGIVGESSRQISLGIINISWTLGTLWKVVYSIGFGLLSTIVVRMVVGGNCTNMLVRFLFGTYLTEHSTTVKAIVVLFLILSALIVWAVYSISGFIQSMPDCWQCLDLFLAISLLVIGIECLVLIGYWAKSKSNSR